MIQRMPNYLLFKLISFSRKNSVGKYLASIFYNAITTLFMVKCVLLMIKNNGQWCDSNIMKLFNLKGFFLFISNWSPKPFIQQKNDKHYIYNVYTDFVEWTFNIVKSTHIYAVDKLKILNITLFIVTHQIISRFSIDSADDEWIDNERLCDILILKIYKELTWLT